MFFKNRHTLFLRLLIIGTIIAVSSNSWFTAWLGLEINLIRITPIILVSLNKNLTEAAIKYFLTQAIASIIIIFSITLLLNSSENIVMEIIEIIISLSLIIKIGIAPLHFWFPQVSNNFNWTQCLIIFTWQKIAPLILLISLNFKLTIFSSVASALVGAAGGFNQTIFKILLTYSSISHGSWIIIRCLINIEVWIIYFFIYRILSLAIIEFLSSNKIKKINQIFINSDSYTNKIIFSTNILSLGGLPPFLGFSAKLSVIIFFTKNYLLVILIPLIFRSLVSLFFYTRIIYSNFMNLTKKKLFLNIKSIKPINMFFVFRFLLNILSPFLIIFN